MRAYDHKKIEKKWQKIWEKTKIYTTPDKAPGKDNFYLLVEFPYPSGNLHVGHWYAFAGPDILSRMLRMQGKNVLYPIGFDAFGLPAENAAIRNKVNPRTWTESNMEYMRKQIRSMGTSFDWSREVVTCDPTYYRWTQWLFLQLFKKGLVYQKETAVNWCPKDKTVLANEQVVDGKCERCDTEVVQKQMLQWNIRITDYADRLIDDLESLNWPEQIKESQRNWIGRSEGAEIDFALDFGKKPGKALIIHGFEGDPSVGWKPWLKEKLENLGWEVRSPAWPDPYHPEYETVMSFLREQSKDFGENDIIIGHSIGGHFALKLAEEKEILRVVAVAPTIGGLKMPYKKWQAERPNSDYAACRRVLEDHPVNLKAIKAKDKVALFGEIDQGIPLEHSRKLDKTWRVIVVPGMGHMSRDVNVLEILENTADAIRVFTTRPDTLFGATYLVLAPEHPWVALALTHRGLLRNQDEIERYIAISQKKTELERMTNQKEKTGVQLKGVNAINPATGEKIPLYIADYVLGHYGTGAIMAVPAHDERDYEFAKKYGIPLKETLQPLTLVTKGGDALKEGQPFTDRNSIIAIVKHWSEDKYLSVHYLPTDVRGSVSGGIEAGEDPVTAAKREIREETGYEHAKFVRDLGATIHSKYYSDNYQKNLFVHFTPLLFQLEYDACGEIAPQEASRHEVKWMTSAELTAFINRNDYRAAWNRVLGKPYTGKGILFDSGEFNGLTSDEAIPKIGAKFGRLVKQYHLRDWIVSRQRYWGVPIPIIHCAKCGAVPVPDKDLPVELPAVKDYLPDGRGKSPLAKAKKFVQVKCPQCKGKAERETDTLDTFVDSSWYFLRYTDPKNSKRFAGSSKQKNWMPIDLYSGGAEHTTMHLLYSRFWHKALFDLGLVGNAEPYTRRMNRSIILGPDGQKMSKSRGNVVDPDEVVERLGADTVRMYLAFIGPYNEVSSFPWNPDGVVGVRRFLERVWKLKEKIVENKKGVSVFAQKLMHQTIKKVGEDVVALKFNTAIAQMMHTMNFFEKQDVTKEIYEDFLRVLAPFAPHMTEELWAELGHTSSIHNQDWPIYDPSKILDAEVRIAVQVNGKTRGDVEVAAGADDSVVKQAAREAVASRLEGKKILRTIVVPGRLVNFVIEG